MLAKTILLALVATPLVAAHGKIAVVTGDAGGNGTGLAIKGGIVPGAGSNSKVRLFLPAPSLVPSSLARR